MRAINFCSVSLDTLKTAIDRLDNDQLEQLAAYIRVRQMRGSPAHRLELTRKLDDRDQQNWLDQDNVIDEIGKSKVAQNRELVAFLAGLGENDNLRGEFVEKDNKGRNIEVALVGKAAVYFHIEPETHTVRILRIVMA
jgi:hypothetical protein